jgi:hypothetical protein
VKKLRSVVQMYINFTLCRQDREVATGQEPEKYGSSALVLARTFDYLDQMNPTAPVEKWWGTKRDAMFEGAVGYR